MRSNFWFKFNYVFESNSSNLCSNVCHPVYGVLVYKSLHGLAPQYLVEDCELVAAADRRQLRSSDIATFVIPRTYTRLGDRAFPVAGLRQFDLTL